MNRATKHIITTVLKTYPAGIGVENDAKLRRIFLSLLDFLVGLLIPFYIVYINITLLFFRLRAYGGLVV